MHIFERTFAFERTYKYFTQIMRLTHPKVQLFIKRRWKLGGVGKKLQAENRQLAGIPPLITGWPPGGRADRALSERPNSCGAPLRMCVCVFICDLQQIYRSCGSAEDPQRSLIYGIPIGRSARADARPAGGLGLRELGDTQNRAVRA